MMDWRGMNIHSLVPRPFEGRRNGLVHTECACASFFRKIHRKTYQIRLPTCGWVYWEAWQTKNTERRTYTSYTGFSKLKTIFRLSLPIVCWAKLRAKTPLSRMEIELGLENDLCNKRSHLLASQSVLFNISILHDHLKGTSATIFHETDLLVVK